MFDMDTALNIIRIKCEEVIEEAEAAKNSNDVDFAYADWCEAQGMEILLTSACGKCLHAINDKVNRLVCEAWSAWNRASNRINYDPITGNPRRV